MLANNLEIILSLQAAVYHNPVTTDFKHATNEANPLPSEIKKQVICVKIWKFPLICWKRLNSYEASCFIPMG